MGTNLIVLKKGDKVICRDLGLYPPQWLHLGDTYEIGGVSTVHRDRVWLKDDPLMQTFHYDCFSLISDDPPTKDIPQAAKEAAVLNLLHAADEGLITEDDAVNLPAHYARFKIEPIKFCIENNLNGFQFNIVKYIMRHDAKNGVEDLRKARRYLDMFIKFVEGNPDWWRADGR